MTARTYFCARMAQHLTEARRPCLFHAVGRPPIRSLLDIDPIIHGTDEHLGMRSMGCWVHARPLSLRGHLRSDNTSFPQQAGKLVRTPKVRFFYSLVPRSLRSRRFDSYQELGGHTPSRLHAQYAKILHLLEGISFCARRERQRNRMYSSPALRRCRNITAPSAIMRNICRVSDGGGFDQKSLGRSTIG